MLILHSREKRFAYIKNKQVEKINFDRPEHRSLVGNIYYGTVTKVLPGMNAVFIDIGEEKNAYLHRDVLAVRISYRTEKQKSVTSFVHQGEKMLVQVDKDATGTKGPRVTGIIEIQGTISFTCQKDATWLYPKKSPMKSKKQRYAGTGQSIENRGRGNYFPYLSHFEYRRRYCL